MEVEVRGQAAKSTESAASNQQSVGSSPGRDKAKKLNHCFVLQMGRMFVGPMCCYKN